MVDMRTKFGNAHVKFWQSTDRAKLISDLVRANVKGRADELLGCWAKLLGGNAGILHSFSAQQVLTYLEELHDLRCKYLPLLVQEQLANTENLFMGTVDENIFARLYGAIIPYATVNEPIVIPGNLDYGFLLLRGTIFSHLLRVDQNVMSEGLHAASASFQSGLAVFGTKIGGAGLYLNGTRNSARLTLHDCTISSVNLGSSDFNGIEIVDTVIQQGADFRSSKASFFFVTGSVFQGETRFQKAEFSGRTTISARFFKFPEFFDSKLSDETRVEGIDYDPKQSLKSLAKVDGRKILEGDLLAIRHLRIHAQHKRWLREEVKFFAEEQRVERKLLTLPSRSIEFAISWIYDKASGYGASVTAAVSAFVLFNLAACLLFHALLSLGTVDLPAPFAGYRIGLLSDSIQVENVSFSSYRGVVLGLQNVFNPLALFSGKSLVTVHSPCALSISLFQIVGSLALLALLILAIKTRFQRGSGGGSM